MNHPLSLATGLRLGTQLAQEQIRVIKASDRDILPERRAMLLKRIDDAQSEVGRISKLLNEIRADVLHLTTE